MTGPLCDVCETEIIYDDQVWMERNGNPVCIVCADYHAERGRWPPDSPGVERGGGGPEQ